MPILSHTIRFYAICRIFDHFTVELPYLQATGSKLQSVACSLEQECKVRQPFGCHLAQRRWQDAELPAIFSDGAAGHIEAALPKCLDDLLVGQRHFLFGD
jgi:hypothetical protein